MYVIDFSILNSWTVVIHVEEYESRSEAMKREKYYKTGKGREDIAAIVKKGRTAIAFAGGERA